MLLKNFLLVWFFSINFNSHPSGKRSMKQGCSHRTLETSIPVWVTITENLKYLMSDIKIVSLLLWTIKNTFNFTFKKTTLSQPWNKKNEIMVLLFLETCHFALFSFTICSFPFKNIIRWKWGHNQWEQLKHVKITSI